MKIAFIVNKFPTISETFILNQITGLMDMGHQVEIFAQLPSTETEVQCNVAKYDLLNYTHYCAAIPKNKTLRRIKTLFLIIMNFFRAPMKVTKALKILLSGSKQFSYPPLYFVFLFLGKKFDIIHAHFGPAGNIGLLVKQACVKAKLVTTFYGYDIASYVQLHGSHIYDKLLRNGDLFTYISESGKKKVLSLGCPSELMVKLPMGVHLDRLPLKKRQVSSNGKINVLSVGRLVEMKGREYAIKAMAQIVRKFPNVYYNIVGNGPLFQSLQELIDSLKVTDNIALLGWVSTDDLSLLYDRAHLFLHPSVTSSDGNMEGQGVVLVEAQACGLPVVATNHGAFPETVCDGKSAFLVPEKDVDALAEKLEYLITHPETWPQMGIAGREYVQKNYDIKTLNQKLAQIYQSIL